MQAKFGTSAKFLCVLCAFALAIALIPVGAFSALADEGSDGSTDGVQGVGEQTATAPLSDEAVDQAATSSELELEPAVMEDASPQPAPQPEPQPAEAQQEAKAAFDSELSSANEPSPDDIALLSATNYTPDSPNFSVVISGLSMTPSADVWPNTPSKLDFNWRVAFSGVQNSFKDGDTVTIPTNLGDLYTFGGGWTHNLATANGTVVATLGVTSAGIVITFNAAAEAMGLTSLEGMFPNYYESFKSKNLGLDADAAASLTVASASTVIGIKGGKRLIVSSVGSGSAALESGGNEIVLSPGNSASASGSPSAGETLLEVRLTKADGSSVILTPDGSGKVTVSADDLALGTNTITYKFSVNPSGGGTPMNEWRWDKKEFWGRDTPAGETLDTSVRFSAELNYQALLGLYQSEGANLNHFGVDNAMSNLFFEDTLPGGSAASFAGDPNGGGVPHVYARMAYYTTAANSLGETVTFPCEMAEGGHAAQTDLIASGVLAEVAPTPGESLASFRARVMAAPLTWGIFKDSGTGASTFMCNLGSPGNASGPAVKATDLWPDKLAADPELDKLNGAANCVGGNVQAFRIDYYGNYIGNPYWLLNQTNTLDVSYTDGAGVSRNKAVVSNPFDVPGTTALAVPATGWLNVTKVDALTSAPIQNAHFKVEVWDSGLGDWRNYTDSGGTTVEGDTDSTGFLSLGVMTPGDYRLVEESAPTPYDAGTAVYSSVGGGAISASGEFSVALSDTQGVAVMATNTKTFSVTYHANGGTGTIVDPDSPYEENNAWSPLAPGTAITRAHHSFVGWNTAPDGLGTPYAIGQNYIITGDVDLYAQWSVNTYPVSYESADTSKGAVSGGPETVAHGSNAAMAGVTVAPVAGHEQPMPAWSYVITKDDGTFENDTTDDPTSVPITGATVFTANFQEKAPVALTYVSNDSTMGSVTPGSENVSPASGIAVGATAAAELGYHFVKWTNDVDATETTDAALSAAQVDAVAKASGIYEPVTFTAHFAEDPNIDITYVSEASVMGDVSPSYESIAPATGAASGATAAPLPGYRFVKWSNDVDATETTDAVLSGAQVDAVAKASGVYAPVVFTAHFEEDPATTIEVTKNVDKDVAKPSDILTYTIHVANTSTAKSQGLFIKDLIPANTTFISCDDRGTYSTTSANENYVKWWIEEGLDGGASLDLTLQVRVNECQDGTEITNVALWQETAVKPSNPDAENRASNTNEVKTTVQGSRPALALGARTGDELPGGGVVSLAVLVAVCGIGALVARGRTGKPAARSQR